MRESSDVGRGLAWGGQREGDPDAFRAGLIEDIRTQEGPSLLAINVDLKDDWDLAFDDVIGGRGASSGRTFEFNPLWRLPEEIYAIATSRIPGVGGGKAKQILNEFGSFKKFYLSMKPWISKVLSAKSDFNYHSLIERCFSDHEHWIQFGENVIALGSSRYPIRLSEIPDPPIVLHVQGDMPNGRRVVSIVGTRKPSIEGLKVTEELVSELAEYDVQIVSGLAYGVDITAHCVAMKNHIDTYAVLGSGLGNVYPSSHHNYARAMSESGGLITEYPPQERARPRNFPMRNRIIAGLSDLTIVVESMDRGGALITANLAFDFDREVMAVPGGIHTAHSKGCNLLIRENKARLLTSVEDLARYMGWDDRMDESSQRSFEVGELSPEEEEILKAIGMEEEISIDELMRRITKSGGDLSQSLIQLELRGVIEPISGSRLRMTSSREGKIYP